jgi:hypothetical protein
MRVGKAAFFRRHEYTSRRSNPLSRRNANAHITQKIAPSLQSYLASKEKAYEFYVNLLMQQHRQNPTDGHVAVVYRFVVRPAAYVGLRDSAREANTKRAARLISYPTAHLHPFSSLRAKNALPLLSLAQHASGHPSPAVYLALNREAFGQCSCRRQVPQGSRWL